MKNEDDLTSWFSKTFERFVIKFLLDHIGDKLDMRQFGGVKGVSTMHYLIEFVSFVLYNWDLSKSHAVVGTMVDFSKAFNRVNHTIIITKLADLGVPNWLLKIIIGFLTDRKLQVRFKGSHLN